MAQFMRALRCEFYGLTSLYSRYYPYEINNIACGRGAFVNRKLYGIFVGFVVLTATITGCATSSSTPTKITNTTNQTRLSANQLTKSIIIMQIKKQEENHVVSKISFITLKNLGSQAYAFVSFNEDGKLKYENIFQASTQGTGWGEFSATKINGYPIQSDQQVAGNGYNFITGVVVDDPSIKNIVITFSNGDVKQVSVQNGQFWFFGKIGTSELDAYSKHMIGVSNQGDFVINKLD
jgi:hypothetical protein